MIYLDTHVIVWLVAGKVSLFSARVLNEIEDNELVISPVVKLELEYLFDSGKIRFNSTEILNELERSIGLEIKNGDLSKIIDESVRQTWTKDPFDRMIVSQAKLDNMKLITKDEKILTNYKDAIWEMII